MEKKREERRLIHWNSAWKEPWIVEREAENGDGRQKERSPPALATVRFLLNSTPYLYYVAQREGWLVCIWAWI